MELKKEYEELFDVLHDGEVLGLKKNQDFYDLQIESKYLSELFDENFDFFVLKMKTNDKIRAYKDKILIPIRKVFDWEILDAKYVGEYLEIYCSPGFKEFGMLKFKVEKINIFTNTNKNIDFKILKYKCISYWGNR